MSRLRDWRLKVLVQGILSFVPGGERLNFELVRRVTKTYPASDEALDADRRFVERHLEALERHTGVRRTEARCFEFGAGWDLAGPLLMAAAGVSSQTIVDIKRLARDDLVADIGRRLGLPVAGVGDLPSLGITYVAPVDVSATGLSDGSFDLVTSTNTLEHIPANEIPPLLRECSRLLTPSGVCSFRIDYGDHYHYFDPSVSQYNFLRYSDRLWQFLNPSLHFQNRLRHRDYVKIFNEIGFVVVEDGWWRAPDDQIAALEHQRLAPRWRHMSATELSIVGTHVVLRARN